MSEYIDRTMIDGNIPGRVVPRWNSLFAVAIRNSDNFVAEADIETTKKKKEKIDEINTEILRRKTAFDTI